MRVRVSWVRWAWVRRFFGAPARLRARSSVVADRDMWSVRLDVLDGDPALAVEARELEAVIGAVVLRRVAELYAGQQQRQRDVLQGRRLLEQVLARQLVTGGIQHICRHLRV